MSEWVEVQLQHADILLIDGDRGTNYPNADDFIDSGYCLFLNAKNVTKNGFKFDECMFIDENKDKILGGGKLNRNDIIITTRGTVGNIAFYDISIKQAHIRINSGMAILRNLNDGLDNIYLKYFLTSSNFLRQINRVVFGSAQPQLTIKTINNFHICFPTSLAEQRKIARILSTVDAVIEKTEAAIAKYKAIKSGMMRDLFTRGIDLKTGKLRPRFEDSPGLYKESELGWVSKEWEVVRIGDIVKDIVDNRGKTPEIKDNGVIPLIETVSITNVEMTPDYSKANKFVDYSVYEKWFRNHIEKGDVLISTVGEYAGSSAYLVEKKGEIAQNLIGFRFNNHEIATFFFYWTKLHSFSSQVFQVIMVAAQPSIKVPHLLKFKIQIPMDKKECGLLVDKITVLSSVIDREQGILKKHQHLKQALMSDLLTGKVRVKYEEEKTEKV
jgi:type I restriction enzyme, S subunit